MLPKGMFGAALLAVGAVIVAKWAAKNVPGLAPLGKLL